MNADLAEAKLAKRAVEERWTLVEFLKELRRQFPETAPAPRPPESTDEIPGTLEKCKVMKKRVMHGYMACHPRDPRIVNGRVIQPTVNENGGNTEYEERNEIEVHFERIARQKKKADCDPAMTERLDRIDELLDHIRTRRGN